MTKKVETKVEGFLSYWKEALGLQNWDFTIVYGEIQGDDKAWAESDPAAMYDEATLTFNLKNFEGKTDSFIERTVIHELVHLLDRDRSTILSEIEKILSPEVWRLYDRVNYQLTEALIDRIATALYRSRYDNAE